MDNDLVNTGPTDDDMTRGSKDQLLRRGQRRQMGEQDRDIKELEMSNSSPAWVGISLMA